MKYKLLCVDLDGTLLTDYNKLNKQDAEALKEAAEITKQELLMH